MADTIPPILNSLSSDDLASLQQTTPNWIAKHCWILPKAGGMVKFELNEAQMLVDHVIEQRRKELRQQGLKKPVCVVILKARQEGISTYGLGRQYKRIYTNKGLRAMMAAHEAESSERLFEKVDLFQKQNPAKLPTQFSNRRELKLADPQNSSIWVATAGKDDLGRSGTIQDFHGSEFGFWANPETTLNSVMQCVPDDPDCTVILESTANGVGGALYDIWKSAIPCVKRCKYMSMPASKSDWIAIFLPWHIFHEYKSKVEPGFKRTDYDDEIFGNETDEAEKYGLTDEQLQWRRNTIKTKCGQDLDKFNQEFPSCDSVAFIASGRPVFSQSALLAMRPRDPIETGVMQIAADGTIILDINDSRNWVEVWQKPLPGLVYAIGADTAEGLDPEERKDPDQSSAHVIRQDSGQVVAKISGWIEPDAFGEQLDLLGRWYNEALLGVEVNNSSGGATRQTLKDLAYPNMFYHQVYDQTADKWTPRLGWETNKQTRMMILTGGEGISAAIREGRVKVYSASTIHQLKCFVYDKTGKPCATTGEHDDDVMSLAVCWHMVGLAIAPAKEPMESAGEYIDRHGPKEFRPSMLIGGVDNVSAPEEYEDDMEEAGEYR